MSSSLRTGIAFITSVVILTLLGLTFVPASTGYSYRPGLPGRILYDRIPDFTERVHVMLNRCVVPATTDRVPVEENGRSISAPVVEWPISALRHTMLAFAAVLFAFVGLIVLWWGRDRPSFWLGLFLATFASPLLNPYGILPAWAMLLVAAITSLLTVISLYSLYGLAEAVACRALTAHPVEQVVKTTRIIVIALLLISLGADLGGTLLPVLFGVDLPSWFDIFAQFAFSVTIVIGFIIAPLAVLAMGAFWSQAGTARRNAVVILAMTTVGLFGVMWSAYHSLSHGRSPGFDNSWFTLVLIPIGFAITIPWLKVVDVRVVLSRALVLAFMTALVTGLIAASETLLKQSMRDMSWQAEVVIAFVIVLLFNTFDRIFGDWARRLVYRRESERVTSLRKFARGTPFYKSSAALLGDLMSELLFTLGASRAAVYHEDNGNYIAIKRSSGDGFVDAIGYDDRAFVTLRAEAQRADLAQLTGQASALGRSGHAFPMALSGHVIGALVVGQREDEAEGTYVREELEALDEVAQKVADALFRMRARAIAAFVSAVAAGSIGDGDVVRKARELQDQGLLGADR